MLHSFIRHLTAYYVPGSQAAFWVPEQTGAFSRVGVPASHTPELLLHPTCVSSTSRATPPPAGRAGSTLSILAQERWTLGKQPFCISVSVWASSLVLCVGPSFLSLSLTIRSVALASGCLGLNHGSTTYWPSSLDKPLNFPRPPCPRICRTRIITVPTL